MAKNAQLRAGAQKMERKKIGCLARILAKIRNLDIVVLTNAALLIAIIVLFSFLIMNITKCISPDTASHPEIVAMDNVSETTGIYLGRDKITLPIKKFKPKFKAIEPVVITNRGETTIDGELPGEKLAANTNINGNLILQNMNRYTLPCGTTVRGNLILRDVGLVRFCGKFVVSGDIYVSRRTGFGPIPRNAKIAGQIIF